MEPIRFVVDGDTITVADVPPTTTLLEWLRATGRTGTKEGCAEGDCGACTVALRDGARWRSVCSCLVLLPMVHDRQVVTAEGLADDDGPHAVQAAMVQALGSQCGYCTPGFVMSLFEACYRDDLDTPWKRDDQLCGNLCRCTGYRPIRDALDQVAGLRPPDRFRLEDAGHAPGPHAYEAGGGVYHAPDTIEGALRVLASNPDTRIVCGATDLGLDITQQHVRYDALLSLDRILALRQCVAVDGGWRLGATVALSDLEDWSTDRLPALHRMLRYFGSRQIKHRATLGGNLCNASPIGDLAPVLLAHDARMVLVGPDGERQVPAADFFTGYRQTALRPGELLGYVEVPAPPADARLGAYKVSRRRELDISAVSACLRVEVDGDGVVTLARFAYGGMAATPARATSAEAAAVGQPWNEATAQAAGEALSDDFTPLTDHRGTAWFRATLARNLLLGFYEETLDQPFVPLSERHVGTVILEAP